MSCNPHAGNSPPPAAGRFRKRVLAVGTATVDVINEVERYPEEDSEIRVLNQRICRGGNAANTLVILSQLGYRCSWAGVIAQRPESGLILDDLTNHSVGYDYAVRCPGGHTPTSYVTLSRNSASRTIIHHRQLREYSAEDFSIVDTALFDWIHFEGRNPSELEKMMGRVGPHPCCSLEVEKPRAGIEQLFAIARVILFSSDYARYRGFVDGGSFLKSIKRESCNAQLLTCAWGERGAWGMDAAGTLVSVPPTTAALPTDTLGAGDVFNAGVIDGVLRRKNLPELLSAACRLAAVKCQQAGLSLD